MEVKIYVSQNITGKIFEKRVIDVIKDLGIETEIVTINDSPSPDVFYTPALYLDNQLVSSGKFLSKEEIHKFFV